MEKTKENDNTKEEVIIKDSSGPFNNASSFNNELPANINYGSPAIQELESLSNLAKYIITSKLCPLKTEGDVIVAILTGKELNLPPMVSISNIYPINGKATMGIHLIRAILLKNGIAFKKDLDYEPLYAYAVKDGNGTPKVIGIGTKANKPENATISNNPVDYITKYTFSRLIKRVDGSYIEQVASSSFKMSDAKAADLLDKTNWKNYPALMLDARAFSPGAREIASDLIFGLYSINELADSNNINYTMTPNAEEYIVTD